MGLLRPVWIHPLEALAMARHGDGAGAAALIGTTPLDCYLCLRVRGQIAAWPGTIRRADRWFAAAVRQAPSLPFAYAEWGQSLLERGDPDGAIAKFNLANQKGPHFADPLEGWGEALMAQEPLAPGAGEVRGSRKIRAQLGPAASEMGRGAGLCGARRTKRRSNSPCAGLDLSAADKAELARSGAIATNP